MPTRAGGEGESSPPALTPSTGDTPMPEAKGNLAPLAIARKPRATAHPGTRRFGARSRHLATAFQARVGR